jgi:hypothetical protein
VRAARLQDPVSDRQALPSQFLYSYRNHLEEKPPRRDFYSTIRASACCADAASVERTFAHTYDTGGMRRTHLRGHSNILERSLILHSGFNLGLVVRQICGVGTPRGLQSRSATLMAGLVCLWSALAADLTL